jgi:hypothetical protein
MHGHEWLTERFEENGTHLRAVAYRMLGSLSEADEAVQEAWLHLSRSDTSGVQNLGGWPTTVVARVCLDMLRSRREGREEPLGAPGPDPIVSRADRIDPEYEALLADLVGLALLAVLDPDVVLRAVSGGVPAVASREVRGAPVVAEQALTFSRLARFAQPALVNGAAEVVVAPGESRLRSWALRSGAGRSWKSTYSPTPRLRQLDLSVLDN